MESDSCHVRPQRIDGPTPPANDVIVVVDVDSSNDAYLPLPDDNIERSRLSTRTFHSWQDFPMKNATHYFSGPQKFQFYPNPSPGFHNPEWNPNGINFPNRFSFEQEMNFLNGHSFHSTGSYIQGFPSSSSTITRPQDRRTSSGHLESRVDLPQGPGVPPLLSAPHCRPQVLRLSPQPKLSLCRVCKAEISNQHNYYGCIGVCVSCRGFFRRSVQSGQHSCFECLRIDDGSEPGTLYLGSKINNYC